MGIFSRVNICFFDTLNTENKWMVIPFREQQYLYNKNTLIIYFNSSSSRKRIKYSKEKIDSFFSDLNNAIKEQEHIDKRE